MNQMKKQFNDKGIYLVPVINDIDSYVNGVRGDPFHPEDSPFYYPAALTSYHYWKGKKDFEKLKGYGTTILADSGGYQLKTQGADIEPKDVAKWFDEEPITAGAVLDDIPMTNPKGERTAKRHHFSITDYTKHAEKTKENIQEILEVDPDIQLLNIMQCGEKFSQGKTWFDIVSDYDLDGWMLSVEPATNHRSLVFSLAYLLENDVKNVHILGRSGITTIAIMLYAKNYFENVTFDATEPIAFKYWCLLMPSRPRMTVMVGKKGGDRDLNGNKFPCTCPVCKEMDVGDDMPSDNSKLYAMHNIYHKLLYIRQCDYLRQNKDKYLEFINNDKAKKWINILDECIEKGVTQVVKNKERASMSLKDI